MKEKNGQALTLNSLMDCNLYDVSLVHEQGKNESVLVDKLNRNILTEQGQKDWSDVMQARITRITGSRLGLDVCVDGCSAQRLSAFTHAINGECSLQNYDRWVRDENRIYTFDDNRIKLAEYPIKTVNLVATYEEILNVPYEDRVACYSENRGRHFIIANVKSDKLQETYNKALDVIEMDDAHYQDQRNPYTDRRYVIERMRDCLLADELKPGDKVLFVCSVPYGGADDFSLRGGVIMSINTDDKTCSIRGEFFDMDSVKAHYVLGRYCNEINEKHYGKRNVEVLFGENRALAQMYLMEAREAWEEQNNKVHSQDSDQGQVLSI